jgi:hypothetical protein
MRREGRSAIMRKLRRNTTIFSASPSIYNNQSFSFAVLVPAGFAGSYMSKFPRIRALLAGLI